MSRSLLSCLSQYGNCRNEFHRRYACGYGLSSKTARHLQHKDVSSLGLLFYLSKGKLYSTLNNRRHSRGIVASGRRPELPHKFLFDFE